MCAGALINARVQTLVFGAADLKAGATGSLYNVCTDPRMNHNLTVKNGVMAPESQAQLQEFFAQKRDK
jgi:tRNA(adenine34) deaminase